MSRRLLIAVTACMCLALAGCTSSSGTAIPVPTPGSTSGATPGATPSSSGGAATTATSSSVGSSSATSENPALDSCDDTSVLPCVRQVADLSLPLAGVAMDMTYSSDRAAGRTVDRAPSADQVGLAGWTLSVLDSYDPATRTEITGTGTRRSVTGVAQGDAVAVAAADGRTVDVFDAQGRQTARMDADTGATDLTFAWGAHGLATVSDAGGVALTVDRAADGTPVRLRSAAGASTGLGTVEGRLAALVYPDGSRALLATDTHGLVTALRPAAGTRATYTFDETGRLSSVTDGGNQTTTYDRHVDAQTATVTTTLATGAKITDSVTASGDTTTYGHTDGAGGQARMARSGAQRTFTGADGTRATVTLAPDPRWGNDAPVPASVTSGTVTLDGSAERSPNQAVKRTMSVNGKTWTFGYDPAARTATRTDPTGVTTTVGYDGAGRVQRTVSSSGVPVTYTYGQDGRIGAITIGTEPGARTWRYTYSGHTLAVTDPAGGVQRRTYSATGALLSIAGPGGSGLSLQRDSADRVIGFAAPAGGAYAVTWGANGQVAAVNAPGTGDNSAPARYTSSSYDASGHLVGQSTGDSTVSITRDAAGRATSMDPGTGPVAAAYDAAGNLQTLITPATRVSRSYAGSLLTEEKSTGVVSSDVARTLTATGQTASVTVAGAPAVDYSYDDAGRVVAAGDLKLMRDKTSGQVSAQTLGTLTDTFTRNQFGELMKETVTDASGSALVTLTYSRDGLGRVTGTVTAVHGQPDQHTGFGYDPAGRLVNESVGGQTRSYTYDAAGNLTSITAGGTSTKLTYDARNDLVSAGAATFQYDGSGRVAKAGTRTYSYDGLGRMLSVKTPGQPDIAYSVDGFGRRVATSSGGSVSSGVAYLDSLHPAAVLNADGSVSQQYVYATGSLLPSYVAASGHDYLEIADATGSPGLVLDAATGAVADRVVRTGYGAVVSETHPGFQIVGFSGGLTDPTSGLVHFGARDYDPAVGRWLAPDPLYSGGGSGNLYEYVGGDPVDRADPTGQFCDYFSTGVSVTGAIGGVGGTASVGLGTTGSQLGVSGTAGTSAGAETGVSVVITCLDKTDPSSPSDLGTFGGGGNSFDVGLGPVSTGVDIGYNDAGGVSSTGSHFGVGPSVGPSASATDTDFWCLAGCPPENPNQGADPYDPGPDHDNDHADGVDDCPGGICSPTPSDPGDGGAPPANACEGGANCDPGQGGSGGPDNPTGTGPRSTGDPHLRTADQTYYDLQAVGEFTWLTSDTADLTVQVRQQPMADSKTIAMTTAVALGADGDRLMISSPTGPGAPMGVTSASTTLAPFGRTTLPHGDTVARSATGLVLTMKDGTRVWVRTNPRGLDVNADLPATRQNHMHGLAGPFTGQSGGPVQTKSGSNLTTTQLRDYDTLYRTYGDSWRITQAESLFTDKAGDATAFDDRAFPDRTSAAPNSSAQAAAKAVCASLGLAGPELAACLFDVAATGDAGFASATALSSDTTPGAAVATGNGSISGDITPGQTVSGNLSAGASKDYSFTVPAGAVAYFAAAPGCTAPADLRYRVQDDQGVAVTGAESVCSDLGRVRFDKAGTYRLHISGDSGASGPYAVVWKASRPDTSRPLAAGGTLNGTIDLPGAYDYATLTVTAGTVAYFAADSSCTAPTDPNQGALRWSVINPAGLSFTGSSSVCDDLGRVRFTQDGVYQLVITSENGGTGRYSVSWSVSRPDATTPMNPGDTATGSIDHPGAYDYRTLTVAAGDVGYFAAAAGCTPASSGQSGLRWQIEDPAGVSYTGSDGICDDLGRVQFTQAGTYRLLVDGENAGIGNYSVTWVVSRPDKTQPLTPGTAVSGTIDRPGAQDLWTFTVAAGASVKLAPAVGCSTTTLRLVVQDSNGVSQSGTDRMCDGVDPVTLKDAGTYRVVVTGAAQATGGYSFTLTSG